MKYVVVGGVAGGATAAARLRRNDEKAEIILFEKGEHVSYATCGLPYYVGNVIKEEKELLLQTPLSFSKRYNIDVRVGSEVIAIDTRAKAVTVKESGKGEYLEKYDKLLLAPGATPVIPPIEGIFSDGVFVLRDIQDSNKIKDHIARYHVDKAIIIGAGFIGVEMVENLLFQGVDVTLLEKSKQVKHALDMPMASILHTYLENQGVELCLNNEIIKIERLEKELEVTLRTGEKLSSDIIILAIGVRPKTELARQAGLRIGETGGIWVNEFLQTSEDDIYAVGDAIEFPHPVSRKPWLCYMANPASRQARIAADNMIAGNITKYEGAIGTVIAKIMDMTAGATGLNGKKLKELGIPYQRSYTHAFSHAGYYPGAKPLSIKLTFNPEDGKLYGGQCVGFDGVDKRVDQIALIIKNGGTVYDLTRLEQAYAPPFSSAKDPLAIAGYVASNIISGKMPVFYREDVENLDLNQVQLLDVRTREEFVSGAIQGALNIPVDELRERLNELPATKPIYIYCQSGMRGYLAQQVLLNSGFKEVYNLSGGYKTFSINR